ncbi:hypothetical protein [Streptomyces sp. NPDC089919]|uniref:hypothetical protein n=1 Tax=Streptomyces sp. NPDC089919 TaxID=3155188 RepID=UPI00341E0C00
MKRVRYGRLPAGPDRCGRSRSWPARLGRAARAGGLGCPAARSGPVALVAGCVLLAGCGVPGTGPEGAGDPARGARPATATAGYVRAYFVAPNGPWPVARPAAAGAGPQQALEALLAGPSSDERARGLVTALPPGPHRVRATADRPGQVDAYLPWLVAELPHAAVNQLVCTAAAAPGIPGGRRSADVVVRLHESGLPGEPWQVMCDDTGVAAPLGAPPPAPDTPSPRR